MDDIKTRHIIFNFPGVILSAFIAISFILLLPTKSHSKERPVLTSWEQIVDNFTQMSDQKKLAILIAVNVRAENYLTLDVRREYESTRKYSRKKISKIALEKAKILRELSQYSARTDFRQAFNQEIRTLKSYLRGEITRYDVDETQDNNNLKFRQVLMGIKDKGAFMDIVNRSQDEIILMGNTIYIMAKIRAKSQTALLQ